MIPNDILQKMMNETSEDLVKKGSKVIRRDFYQAYVGLTWNFALVVASSSIDSFQIASHLFVGTVVKWITSKFEIKTNVGPGCAEYSHMEYIRVNNINLTQEEPTQFQLAN